MKRKNNLVNELDKIQFLPYLLQHKGEHISSLKEELISDGFPLIRRISETKFVSYLNKRYDINIKKYI